MNSTDRHFMASGLMKASAAKLAPMALRAMRPIRSGLAPLERMFRDPKFMEVLQSSLPGFRSKLPGLPVTNPTALQAIRRPDQMMGTYASLSHMQPGDALRAQLRRQRAPLAGVVRGYRNMQRTGQA